jgi:hypothetical protein
MKEYVFEGSVEYAITNRIFLEQDLNNNPVLIDQIDDRFPVDKFHHDRTLRTNL